MRIALFTDTFLPQINGVTNTLSRMLQWFEDQDMPCLVFAPQYGMTDPVRQDVERFPSIRFVPYPECRLALVSAARIDASLKAFRPDLVFNMTEFSLGQAGVAAASRRGLPAVSNYSTHFPQYLSYYRADWLQPTAWKYMRQFHLRHQLTLCPSHDTQNRLRQQGIPNTGIFSRGIDMNRFHPAKRSQTWRDINGIGTGLAVLYAGRLSAEKDLDILLEAWRPVQALYGNKVRLLLAGDGPMAAQYKRDFPANTVFLGYLKGEALSVAYASCDLFAFPSTTETFGNVVLEAMASGLPILAAAAGGVKDIIRHGHDGLTFPARDAGHMEDKLIELIASPALRRHYAVNGLASAAARTWDSEFQNLSTHFQQVLDAWTHENTVSDRPVEVSSF